MILLYVILSNKTRKVNLKCKVDTAAQGNVLPVHLFRILYREELDSDGNPKYDSLERSEMILTAYHGGGGSIVKQLGIEKIQYQYKGKQHCCNFYVTDAL